MKITWRRRKMKCRERSGVVSTVPLLDLVGERRDLTQRTQRKRAEITEIRKEERNGLPLARKSPPLQTKGGAPSSSDGGGATGAREEKRSEESLGVSGRWRRLRLRLVLLVWRGRGALLRCRDSA